MPESDLTNLEQDRARPSDVPVSHHDHLSPPAEEVSNEVHIKHRVCQISHRRSWVFRSEQTAIVSVASLRKLLAKVVIEYAKSLSGSLDGQKEQVGHEQEVEHIDSEDAPPHEYVRSCHDRVWQVDHTDEDEGQAGAHDGAPVRELFLVLLLD